MIRELLANAAMPNITPMEDTVHWLGAVSKAKRQAAKERKRMAKLRRKQGR